MKPNYINTKPLLFSPLCRFAVPKRGTLPGADPVVAEVDKECIYLCGNSLGLKPVKADLYIQQQLDKWAKMYETSLVFLLLRSMALTHNHQTKFEGWKRRTGKYT